MSKVKLNEQISFLRRQRGMTQEELAQALGVTNQAVSKWESAQCCPDIQLLPEIAKLFNVSTDMLLGCETESTSDDIILEIRNRIMSLPMNEAYDMTFRLAAAVHATIISKEMHNPGWSADEAVQHAGVGEWGYSCVSEPSLTTTMSKSSIFFSSNKPLCLQNKDVNRIVTCVKPLTDERNFKILAAVYEATIYSEEAYVPPEALSEKTGIPADVIVSRLTGELAPYVAENLTSRGEYRVEGMYLNIIPILSLLVF